MKIMPYFEFQVKGLGLGFSSLVTVIGPLREELEAFSMRELDTHFAKQA